MTESRYAVIQAQGLQYRVEKEEEHILPHMGAEPGQEVTFDRVLLIADGKGIRVGQPVIEGASVKVKVLGTEKGPKIQVGTYKRRKKYRRRIGYRDTLTRVKILDIRG
jgi:large subunit ribosomal protein L21